MTFSKQLFIFLFFIPLLHAINLKKCPSSYYDSFRCGSLEVPIRFPFCGRHAGFDLHCTALNKTVIDLPMSGSFLVEHIDYRKQQITISIPDICVAERLLTFNTSGSPFTPRFDVYYTFLTCPNAFVKRSWYPSILCLSNSTWSFFATSNLALANSMLPSCQIFKRRVAVPVSWLPFETGFSTLDEHQRLLVEWDSPNCRGCEMGSLRCGFKNKGSLEVKCFAEKSGTKWRVIVITLGAIVGITTFASCFAIRIYNSERFVSQRRRNAAITARGIRQPPRWDVVVTTTGLDQSTIESYKKVELGESRRLPGTNGMICPICLSEYAIKDILRCIPECDHCFHVDCIDAWLKIHGSCPICRNSRS